MDCGQAVFLPAKEDCRDATPTVELDGSRASRAREYSEVQD